MLKDRVKWPEGKTYGTSIGINLEGQYFAKLYYPDGGPVECPDVNTGEIFQVAMEGLNDNLPKMLNLLDEYGIKATFYTAAAMADEWPDLVKEIADRGHEIACMGYCHENFGNMSPEEQREVLAKAKARLEEVAGVPVKGFRMPAGEMTEETLKIVKDLGFEYSSSLTDDDVPYIRESCGLVELPIRWELYDLPYFAYTWEPEIPPSQDRVGCADDVLENWLYELEASAKYGCLFNLQLDPQATGEQGRLFMLREIIERIQADPSAWYATAGEMASWFK